MKMKSEEYSELFAKFLGAKIQKDGGYHLFGVVEGLTQEDAHYYAPKNMLFDFSWDWFMQVFFAVKNRQIAGTEKVEPFILLGNLEKACVSLAEVLRAWGENLEKKQLHILQRIQEKGYNVCTCGNCGQVLLHKITDNAIVCFNCSEDMDLSDCPDLHIE
jgi:hypothetical protein